MISKSTRSFVVALATIAFSGVVFAGEIFFSRTGDYITENTGNEVAVPLKDNGGTRLLFWTSDDDQTVAVFFNAECSVQGATNEWLHVRIKIDGAVLKPTNDDKAFCTGRGALNFNEWFSASSSGAKVIANAGQHKVKVTGSLFGWDNSDDKWVLDDISLVVIVGDNPPLVIK